jgi:O-antigen ligase
VTGRIRFDKNQWNGVAIATTVLLVFSFLLGGASRQNELRLAILELSALPLLVMGLQAVLNRPLAVRAHILPLGILAGLAAIPLLQLVPLPPGIWTNLPGRGDLVLALNLIEATPGWAPLSLTPDQTWQSALALLPALAMFLGVLALGSEAKDRQIRLMLGLTVAAIILGSIQLASGGTQFYPWRTTNLGTVVGFFANRNHFATLCLVAMPFAAMLAGQAVRRTREQNNFMLWLAVLLIAGLIVALGVIKSRAGVILLGPVLIGSVLVAWVASGRGRPNPLLLAGLGAAAVAGTAVAVFVLGPLLARFDTGGLKEGRFENWPVVAKAAENYLPVGSGVGSFDPVYRSVEPLQRLDSTFFNQAHNDYLEIWLETGWLGIALLIVFLVWFAKRAWSAWRGSASSARNLQRASTVAIAAILLHSAADYPLRTATMMTILAMCCAILEFAGHPEEQRESRRRHRQD